MCARAHMHKGTIWLKYNVYSRRTKKNEQQHLALATRAEKRSARRQIHSLDSSGVIYSRC